MRNAFKKYWPLIIFPLGIIIDQVTKFFALKLDEPIVIIKNFFSLDLLYNTGAAWGMPLPKWLLVTISLVATIGFLVYFFKTKGSMWIKVSAILVASGSCGNLIDRAFFPNGVIDFLAFKFGSYHFPTFNIADSLVVVGIFMLLIATLVEDHKNGISSK